MAEPRHASINRWLVFGGLFNILVSLPLATPWSMAFGLDMLVQVGSWIGLDGRGLSLPGEVTGVLFLNGFGIVDVSLGVLLLYAAGDVRRRYPVAVIDGIARLLFALVLLYYLQFHAFAQVAWLFVAIELLLGTRYIWLWVELHDAPLIPVTPLSGERHA